MVKEVECTERVISELMMEIAQLREERDYYKINYELLHNKLEDKVEIEDMKKEFEKVAKEGFEDIEDLETSYANWGYSYEADILEA
jgi:hypothetical protein